MPSEWAMDKAQAVEGTFNCTSSRKPLILAIATEIDAARAQGRREGLEEAALLVYDGGVARIELDADLAADIRARIEEPKV